jgi:hypothetical protein
MRRTIFGGILRNFPQSSPTGTTTIGDGIFVLADILGLAWLHADGFNTAIESGGFVNAPTIANQSFAGNALEPFFMSNLTDTPTNVSGLGVS